MTNNLIGFTLNSESNTDTDFLYTQVSDSPTSIYFITKQF